MLRFGAGQKYQFLCCPLPPVCLVPETVLQSNTGQLELFCHVLYFLANQTHPSCHCQWSIVFYIYTETFFMLRTKFK